MYYRDRGAFFEVCRCVCGGGRQDSTGAIARRKAGFYTVIFYYPLQKWAGHGPRLPLSQFPQLGGRNAGIVELVEY
jgi:hypothetical protein